MNRRLPGLAIPMLFAVLFSPMAAAQCWNQVEPVRQTGDPAHRVDLFLVNATYHDGELAAFHADVEEAAVALEAYEPYRSLAPYLNVWKVWRVGVATRSPYYAEYRDVYSLPQWSFAQDHVILLDRNGGGGVWSPYWGWAGSEPVTLVHELSHMVGRLADEYPHSSASGTTDPDLDPNISLASDPAQLKWAWAYGREADGTPSVRPPEDANFVNPATTPWGLHANGNTLVWNEFSGANLYQATLYDSTNRLFARVQGGGPWARFPSIVQPTTCRAQILALEQTGTTLRVLASATLDVTLTPDDAPNTQIGAFPLQDPRVSRLVPLHRPTRYGCLMNTRTDQFCLVCRGVIRANILGALLGGFALVQNGARVDVDASSLVPPVGGTRFVSWRWNFQDGYHADPQLSIRSGSSRATWFYQKSQSTQIVLTLTSDEGEEYRIFRPVTPVRPFRVTELAPMQFRFDSDVPGNWSLGDGGTASGSSVVRTYATEASYTVRFTLSGETGSTSVSQTVQAFRPRPVTVSWPLVPDARSYLVTVDRSTGGRILSQAVAISAPTTLQVWLKPGSYGIGVQAYVYRDRYGTGICSYFWTTVRRETIVVP